MAEGTEETLEYLLGKKKEEDNKVNCCLQELFEITQRLHQVSEQMNPTKNVITRPVFSDVHADTIDLHFAIKQANDNPKIENEVVDYIKKKVDKRRYNIKTTFDWNTRPENVPLVVFCNYSSRIGVDIEYSLRGVHDPEVIVIVMHLCRQALLRGDLSDTDYLLSDNLKRRVAYIGHFAFDDHVYDCEQNRKQRDQLCSELKKILDSRQ